VGGVRFALLGTLTLADGTGNPVTVSGPRQRALLACLLLSANAPVSAGALAEAMWDGSPPPGAATTLRSHVRRLRVSLGPEVAARITACDPGYLIAVGEPELDVLGFGRACRDAGAARRAARWPETSVAAARALELWRGTPLLDVPSQVLHDQFVPGLEQLHLQALEDRTEADLRLGHPDRFIPELRDLAAQYPLREQFHAQLMEALARAGRRAEALEAYRHARRALKAELGIEPGPHLQLLHQQILDGDPALAAPPAGHDGTPQARAPLTGSASSAAGVPRQLPAAVPDFTGRLAELARLSEILDQVGSQAPGTVVISAIGGTAGVGKTALAVHWAHRVARRFPGGQLYVNLGGFDPSGSPVTPGEAVRGFLGALGVPADRFPSSPTAQAGLYRSLLADRQMLILLDNARDEQQVRPLLPGSQGCLVLVTSRSQLAGLAAAENASLLSLDVLPHAEARQMLAARLGGQRTAAEPGAVTEITDLCARLPLALAVAAARAAARPQLPLPGLAAELRDAQRRLDVLDTGDPAASVRAVFSWSYQQLDPAAARMFRLLGLHAGPDITTLAAASLAGVAPAQAGQALGQLTRAYLLTEQSAGRYGCHDLLRAYAAEQARSTEDEQGRHAATGRVLDHYLHTACQAALLLRPQRDPISPGTPLAGVTTGQLTGTREALAWFDAEHQVLPAAVGLAARTGHDKQAWQLAWALQDSLDRRGSWHELIAIQHTALAAASRLGDVAGQAVTHRLTATACHMLADHQRAQAHLMAALALYRQAGDPIGEARTHQTLSVICEQQDRVGEALRHDEQALILFQAAGHRAGQAQVLNAVGWNHIRLGHPERGRTYCRQALTLCQQRGDRLGEADCWDSLGHASHQLGQYDEAAASYDRALSIFRELGQRYREAQALDHLGDTRQASGDRPGARHAWQQAVRILDDLQRPDADLLRAKLDSDHMRPASNLDMLAAPPGNLS
jgi:DNA-binding SARP family transcriptional activator/Tfp pilus assembly protein PilF